VQDINIDMQVLNTTGLAEDTYVDLNKFSFRIDQDAFSGHGKIRNLTENMLVDLALKGTVNLANLQNAYPLKLDQELTGVLNADVTTSFDMNSIEKEQYQNVKSKGTASIRNFSYKSAELPNKINIANASMNFNQGDVNVPQLLITSGRSDMEASGNIHNLIGFLFTDQQLKGNFNVKSKTFSVNDFMVAKTTTSADSTATSTSGTSNATAVKIPSFLDAELNFVVNKLIYSDLVLNNAKGTVIIRDEKATLQNISSEIFDGRLALNGNVSTKNAVPTFSMNLDMNSLDIAKSFKGLDLLQGLAPIAQALQGKLQTQINLSGNLNDDLTPKLNSIAGQALAQILTAKVNPQQLALLSQLDQKLDFINLNDINLDNLKGKLTFNNGMVEVAPFNFNVKGINVNVSGRHGFDMQMNYNITLDVPAKMLGSQIGSTLSKLSAQDLSTMTVPLPIGLTGTFQNPNINLNMQQAIANLTQQIVAQQKKELTQKGVDALGNILSGAGNRKTPDSTATPVQVKKDSVKNEQQTQVKNAAKTILGNILKNKTKKVDTTKKDSLKMN
ncbi:MAG: AsmA-like C-terminal region-containing protein, partial [Gillisia sp.]